MKLHALTEDELEIRAKEYSIVILKKLYRRFKSKSLVFLKMAKKKKNPYFLRQGITWELAAQDIEKVMEPLGGLPNEKSRGL